MSRDDTQLSAPAPGFQFWIDRGGTFTDVVARCPDGTLRTAKLLSENPAAYEDASTEAIRRLLGVPSGAPLPVERIHSVKMGTTVATNALLERAGEPTVLFITRGFGDQLRIGYQNRPRLFDRHIRLPEPLYGAVVEVGERVLATGEVLVALDEAELAAACRAASAAGYRAAAIVFLHAWVNPDHELRAGAIAEAAGFAQVSLSHRVSPLQKIVSRGDTTVVDAYLSPVLRRYVDRLVRELETPDGSVPLYFMKSNGGLADSQRFQGKDAILSGPAGGIIGMVRTCLDAGLNRVIGFDMGGTSTDVSHFSGHSVADCERQFETLVAGVRLRTPMLSIHTVAAGGGSILRFDGQRFRVGPDSAGANPGPACYRRGGPLTVTDCNVMLGRIQPVCFPRVFGPGGNEPIDVEVVAERFRALAEDVSRVTGRPSSPEEVAEGFLRVAVANMANAIKFISVQRGYDVTKYTLACFGGAGGQHACRVADELGVTRVFIHPLAGVLSAVGIGLADISSTRERAFERVLDEASHAPMRELLEALAAEARAEVQSQGVPARNVEVLRRAHLKYSGTDTALVVPFDSEDEMRRVFELSYRTRFAFSMPGRSIVVEALSVEAVGHGELSALSAPLSPSGSSTPGLEVDLYADARWRRATLLRREALVNGDAIAGPAILADENATTVVEPGWRASVLEAGQLLLERTEPRARRVAPGTQVDPVLLEVFNNAFMAIAEQMGVRLANTAHSVNIKERLDFSCALFDSEGNLVANAPHMPVHLGSMGESIKTVLRRNAGTLRPGDVYALNDPYHGGTHLPDVTAVMPVFVGEGAPEFFVAARGHHADIGGITPGSMPPASRTLSEEGILIDNFKLVEGSALREAELRALLRAGPHPARNPDQNVADLRAQIAACERGREELLAMIGDFGLPAVQAYMRHVRDNAEENVRRAIAALRDGEFDYAMDDGARIRVKISVDRERRAATIDFTGTSPERDNNFNAPPAVVHAAVLYVFRTLVDDDIPMNAGCLEPLTIVIPEGSMLAPRPPRATVAGNVETSQCVVDALYGALGTMAASQGTMNNFTFGDARYQYYETIAGGSGAGDGFDGTAAVQTHMTNSRMTDPEVLELRFPVIVEEHSIRAGSGGAGRFRGGDGALRRIRFLSPLTAAIVAGRRVVPPYGMAGGSPGELGRSWVERVDGTLEILGSTDETAMQPGDVFVVSTPSGGGYGAP